MSNIYPKYKNKYNNKSCVCNRGHNHQSRAESGYCNQLDLLVKAGEIREFQTQVKYDLRVNGKHITNHYVDFLVTKNDGMIEVHEYKGMETEVWRIKRRLFEELYPEIPYIVIK